MSDINRIIAEWMGVRRDISGPHFDSDLNACAEVERKLTDEQFSVYRWMLKRGKAPWSREYLCASAPQRAAALAAVITAQKNTP